MDPAEESIAEYMEPGRRIQIVDTLETDMSVDGRLNDGGPEPVPQSDPPQDSDQVPDNVQNRDEPPLIVIDNVEPQSDTQRSGTQTEEQDRSEQRNSQDSSEQGEQTGQGGGDPSGQQQRRGDEPSVPPRNLSQPTPPLPITPHPGGLPPIAHLTLAERAYTTFG